MSDTKALYFIFFILFTFASYIVGHVRGYVKGAKEISDMYAEKFKKRKYPHK